MCFDDIEGLCCICFSNTLKLDKFKPDPFKVCVVFVLAILSNAISLTSSKSMFVLYLF